MIYEILNVRFISWVDIFLYKAASWQRPSLLNRNELIWHLHIVLVLCCRRDVWIIHRLVNERRPRYLQQAWGGIVRAVVMMVLWVDDGLVQETSLTPELHLFFVSDDERNCRSSGTVRVDAMRWKRLYRYNIMTTALTCRLLVFTPFSLRSCYTLLCWILMYNK